MYFADFETTTSKIDETKSQIWVWGLKGNGPNDKLMYDVSMETFFDTIYDKKISQIFFHNLSFDGNYIFKWLLKNNILWVPMVEGEDLDLRNNEWTWICDDAKSIYAMYVKYKDHEFQIMCSYKVLMASIGKLGKALGEEKLDLDYDAYGLYESKYDIPKIAIEYLERDIDVAIKSFTNAVDIYDRKLTTAGMSMNDFKKHYGEKKFADDFGGKVWDYREKGFKVKNILSRSEWDLVYRSYQGGYTFYNPKIENIEINNIDGYSFDVNSLYPSVMLKEKLPYGKMMYSPPKTGSYATLIVVNIHFAIKKRDEYPPLFKVKDKKSIFDKYADEIYNEERVMWEEEFNFIEQYYTMRYTIISKRYFSTKYIFSDWVKLKEHYKINAKNTVERNFHKLILNSLYGKFGQRYKRGSMHIVRDGKHRITFDGVDYLHVEGEKINLINKRYKKKGEDAYWKPTLIDSSGKPLKKANAGTRYGNDLEFVHKVKFQISEQRNHIAVASYITWKAREVLWKAIFENLAIFLYCDTDSVYCRAKPKGLEVHDSEFGAWKPEHRFNKFKVLRAKCYMYFSTHEWKGEWEEANVVEKKISGVSEEGKKLINWDNFHLGAIIEDGKRGSINVDGGKLIINRDFQFREKKKKGKN